MQTQIRPRQSIPAPTTHQAGICNIAAGEVLADSSILPNSTHRLDPEGSHFGRRQSLLVVFARWMGRLDVGGDLRAGSLSDVITGWASMLPRQFQCQTCIPFRAASARAPATGARHRLRHRRPASPPAPGFRTGARLRHRRPASGSSPAADDAGRAHKSSGSRAGPRGARTRREPMGQPEAFDPRAAALGLPATTTPGRRRSSGRSAASSAVRPGPARAPSRSKNSR